MKITVLDGYAGNPGDISWNEIGALGELVLYDRLQDESPDAVAAAIKDAEVVLTNKVQISDRVMELCPGLKYISVLATGYNIIDLDAADRRGIYVSNVPAYGTDAVAQHTVALLLELTNHVALHNAAVHAGRWKSAPDFCFWEKPLMELSGKTAGMVGFGQIGRKTGAILKAMGMRVLAAGSRECPEGKAIAEYVDMDRLFAEADVISLHCPLKEENKELIRRENIEKMKDGVIIINTARGGLVREADLAEALAAGKVAAAGLDVADTEPMREDDPLCGVENCIITPHIAWAAKEPRQRIFDITAANLRAYLAGHPQNLVNRGRK